MDDSEKNPETLIEEIRLLKIAMVWGWVKRLLLARYRVFAKAEAYRVAQHTGSTAYESYHVFPSYEAGNDQPLVEWLLLHKDRGLPASPGLLDFLINKVQGKKPRIRGKKKSEAVEQRDLVLAIEMASYMHLKDLDYDAACARVVEDTKRSESMVKRAYEKFSRFFSRERIVPPHPLR